MKLHTTMNYISRLFLLGIFLFLPTTTYGNTIAWQEQSTDKATLCITNAPDFTAFPNVKINFKLIDGNLIPVTDKDKITQELQVSEDGKPKLTLSDIEKNPDKDGVSYYFIIDKGNRSKQEDVQSILNSFATSYFDAKTDDVTIYTDENNTSHVYFPKPSSGKMLLAQAVSEFETKKGDQPYQVINTLSAVLDDIESSQHSCQKMPIIVMVVGDDVLGTSKDASKMVKIIDRIKTNSIKLSLLHVHQPTNTSFQSEEDYKTFVSQVRGDYTTFISSEQGGVNAAFDQLFLLRQVYSATYRTNSGKDGTHQIEASYNNTLVSVEGESSYSISLKPGEIQFVNPPVTLTRKQTDKDTYDKASETVQVKVLWPDQHSRKLNPTANLNVKRDDDGVEKDIPIVLTEQPNGEYEFTWVFDDTASQASNHFSMKLEAVDEFEIPLQSATSPAMITTTVIQGPVEFPTWAIYLVAAIAAIIVLGIVFLGVLAFVFRSKSSNLIERGRQEAAKIVGEVKKTFVGGAASRKKPLFNLNVIQGPLNMIGTELPVYTESIKLGRDDKKSDLIFYGVDTNSSVSGLHARIERVSGLWRIVAISESGSETFVNGEPLPFNEPRELNPGDKIRLGYLARQAVELEFILDTANHKAHASYPRSTVPVSNNQKNAADDLDKTNIFVDNGREEDFDKTIVPGKNDITEQSVSNNGINISEAEKKKIRSEPVDNVDDIFEGFRNRK